MSEEDSKQASNGDWDSDFPEKKDTQNTGDMKRLPYMQFDKPGNYTIRLVGAHVKFYRHWQPFTDRIITCKEYKNNDPAWQAGFYPRETFAIHVIDRATGELKILEKGSSLFKQFANYKVVNDINPAGLEAPDWVVQVEWPNGNKRQAKYTCMSKAKLNELTQEEKVMIKENQAPLKKIYATTPLETIIEKWEAIPDEAKVKKDKEDEKKAPEPKIEEPVVDTSNDDLFDDDDSTGF
jgi:hypothetical protein